MADKDGGQAGVVRRGPLGDQVQVVDALVQVFE
jgi:hypothetical protein